MNPGAVLAERGETAEPAHLTMEAVWRIREPVHLVRDEASGAIVACVPERAASVRGAPCGELPPLFPEHLGDRTFQEDHGTRFAYVGGSMANGIATPRFVAELARHGMIGFFGAAGLPFNRVVEGLDAIQKRLENKPLPWGACLIHAPHEPDLEHRTARLYAQRDLPAVEVSAFLDLTPSVVLVSAKGLRLSPEGRPVRPRAVFAKVSRPEVAKHFFSPAPTGILRALVDRGDLTEGEAHIAAHVPVATDVTAESDSGGHTDNRPLGALFPVLADLRLSSARAFDLADPPRLGAAGGLGAPATVAAAFALGADYVLTGSVNQSAIESGLSEEGRRLLAQADLSDVAMAAAADMFEMGVKVQVLKRGTLFAARANRLYDLYVRFDGLEALPAAVRAELEQKIFGDAIDAIWRQTEAYWRQRDPQQPARAAADPKHRMALVFRWYLGMASRWAITGEAERRADYQIWCGPAMGAFNAWVRGSFLEDPAQRTVGQIGLNLLEGAAVLTRASALRAAGVTVPLAAYSWRPRRLALE